MTAKNDGGPAYPCENIVERDEKGHMHGNAISSTGLSIRDHFAGLAMQAAITGRISHYGHDNHWPAKDLSTEAWAWADAMLAARSAA